jgi:hypothetical protein
MRVRWATVPRHYRLVACSIEIERLESGASLS